MSGAETAGVIALGRILSRLAGGKPASASEIARLDGLARSTTFDAVRRLKAAGFVDSEAAGSLIAGPILIALGFARYGLAPLHGPAEALLIWLRDQTASAVALTVREKGREVVLLSLASHRPNASRAVLAPIETPVLDESGGEVARVSVAVRANATAAEVNDAKQALSRAKQSLEHYLAAPSRVAGGAHAADRHEFAIAMKRSALLGS